MASRSSVRGIITDYVDTLKSQVEGKITTRTAIEQFGVPFCAGMAWFLSGAVLKNPGNAIVGISIVAALLCAMGTLLFQTRADISLRKTTQVSPFSFSAEMHCVVDEGSKRQDSFRVEGIASPTETGSQNGYLTSEDVKLVDELFVAVLWAILLGLLIVLAMVVFEWAGAYACRQAASVGWRLAISIVVAAIVHFVLVVGVVLKRLRRTYQLVGMRRR